MLRSLSPIRPKSTLSLSKCITTLFKKSAQILLLNIKAWTSVCKSASPLLLLLCKLQANHCESQWCGSTLLTEAAVLTTSNFVRQSLVLDDGIYLISNDGKFASSFPVEGTHPPFITSITIGGLSGPYSQVGLTTHPLESQLLTSLY